MASRTGPVSVTCRTEYRRPVHHRLATLASALAITAMLELVVLTIADVDPKITGAAVIATLGLGLLVAALGRVIDLPAVSLTVDDTAVHLGNAGVAINSFPLDDLLSVKQSTELSADTSMSRSSRTDQFRIKGCRYLQLRFANNPDQEWQVAVIESDPAAAEVLARLRVHRPSKRKVLIGNGSDVTAAGDLAVPAAAQPGYRPADAGLGRTVPRIANAGSKEAAQRLWQAACRRHDAILVDYAQYELEPELVLRYPAVTDVSVESVANFHTALARAQDLRTDEFPKNFDRADEYQQSVVDAGKAWAECERYGRAIGSGLLGSGDQEELSTALSLLDNARASQGGEQADYLDQIHRIVTGLAARGSVHPQQQAFDEIEAGRRRALEAE
ncbi:hypothetical protein [Nocardia sp. 348MFTsu5.1]|uniref:hypothetical protein n=1 Tax=Nocardia sp. 348MFTsu5.1 TaxID=1172185 RepID=UPI0003806238|nr:hypothetical protein [Nocardia sp. 348MFTsu5.1]